MHFICIRSSIDMYEYKYEYMNIHNDNAVDSSQKLQTFFEQLEKAKPVGSTYTCYEYDGLN